MLNKGEFDLDGEKEINAESGFVSLLVLSGEITVKYGGGTVVAQKGGSILIPQSLKALVSGGAEIIYTE